MKKCGAIWAASIFLSIARGADDRPARDAFAEQNILDVMRQVNDYALAHPWLKSDRDWIRATWYAGVMDAHAATGDERYLAQARAWADEHRWQIGREASGFNRLFCSLTWLRLHLLEPAPEKIAPTIAGLDAKLPYSPALGKVWMGHAPNPNSPKHLYADGLFSAPALVLLHKATGDPKYLDFLHDAFWTVIKGILDEEEGLCYRDPGYIGKRSPNGGKILWSRGNGWVFSGLTGILEHLPKSDPQYPRYLELYRRLAKAVAARQEDDGFWRANLGDPQHYPMPESSGTAFFVAGLAWGVSNGLLERETCLPVIIRGWNALVSSVRPDGLLGWVQPVDAEPRPSHPYSAHEYAVGLFLSAGGRVYQLVKNGVITPAAIQRALPAQSRLLPSAALAGPAPTPRQHPLSVQIAAFLARKPDAVFRPTGLTKAAYLEIIAGQVKAMRAYQNAEGRIVDPVEHREKYYATPCYAHGVAVLAHAGHPAGAELLEGGVKALEVALDDLVTGKNPDKHNDFYTWPLALAAELLDGKASPERLDGWKQQLRRVEPARVYGAYRKPLDRGDHRGFYKAYASPFAHNWNLVNVGGEWARGRLGAGDPWYVDCCMTMQLPNFTPHGLYHEKGAPPAYDLFARLYPTAMLQRGYDSHLHGTYRDLLWRGAWTSLFMQSPFGELPTGYRSSQHLWNSAEEAVVFEIYASAYAAAGRMAEAGAFKRAARLALRSIQGQIRPDGSGYIVMNRYPIEAKHGYETYSAHTCYNLLTVSMLAQAWEHAADTIPEAPAPADAGGFVVVLPPPFDNIFASAAGHYAQYEPAGDGVYDPTGLLRVHARDGHPRLGPSDGCASKFSGPGQVYAAGPAWRVNGKWTRLAECAGPAREITVVEQSPGRARFRVAYPEVVQDITLDADGVTVEDRVTAEGVEAVRVWYPMLVFDGLEKTAVRLEGATVTLGLDGREVRFEVLEPKGLTLRPGGGELKNRNGLIQPVFAETDGRRLVYRIRAK